MSDWSSDVCSSDLTLQPLVRPGSMTLLLSDFSNFDERCELQLATIAARSDCRLLWLTDPLEASGLPRGQYRLGLPGRLWWLDGERSRQTSADRRVGKECVSTWRSRLARYH